MNINHLHYFEEVCKAGSITEAAKVCHISQPTATAAINGLEKELGYKLFDRVNNHLYLTAKGQAFLDLSKTFSNNYMDFCKQAKDINVDSSSTLRIGIPSVMSTFFLNDLVPGFQSKFPHIQLEIIEVPTVNGIKMLHHASLDFLFGITDDYIYPNCDSKFLIGTEIQLAVSKEHPLANHKTIKKEQIDNLPLVLISKGSYHYDMVYRFFTDVHLNVMMQSNQISTIRFLVSNNHASSIIYKNVFAKDPKIVCIPFEKAIPANIHVFWQKSSYLTKSMKNFLSFVPSLTFE